MCTVRVFPKIFNHLICTYLSNYKLYAYQIKQAQYLVEQYLIIKIRLRIWKVRGFDKRSHKFSRFSHKMNLELCTNTSWTFSTRSLLRLLTAYIFWASTDNHLRSVYAISKCVAGSLKEFSHLAHTVKPCSIVFKDIITHETPSFYRSACQSIPEKTNAWSIRHEILSCLCRYC